MQAERGEKRDPVVGEIRGIWRARFLERRSRFTVVLDVGGGERECHLHDPGRLSHLLCPGVEVYARDVWRPRRRTGCDVVAVRTRSGVLALEDTRLANKFFPEIAQYLYPGLLGLEAEVMVPGTRLDYIVHTSSGPVYVEAKSTNLVEANTAFFPDAPSRRASRQLDSLLLLSKNGLRAELVFVVLRGDANLLRPNWRVDQVFYRKLCGYRRTIRPRAVRLNPAVTGDTIRVAYGGEIPVKC